MRVRTGVVVAACAGIAAGAALSCSSGSSGGGGSSSGGSTTTTSCTESGVVCVQILVPSSEVSGEQSSCAKTMGTFTMGPCPAAGYTGCCDKGGASMETDCYFPGPAAAGFQQACTMNGGTWTGGDAGASDGGATGAAAFVGTWTRSGTQTVTCPGSPAMTTNLGGNLVIAAGSSSDTIVGTPPNGCMTTYTVSGNVASAMAGDTCSLTTEAGIAETITTHSHTLTLSADGQSLTTAENATIDKTATMTMCTAVASGTFTKQ